MENRDPNTVYEWLMGRVGPPVDPADAHVLASIIAIACLESNQGSTIDAIGLGGMELRELVDACFPHARSWTEHLADEPLSDPPEDEKCVAELLFRFSTHRSSMQRSLAMIIARRTMGPNHLWQDLGFRDRGELSMLMRKHFAPLAQKNSRDMKWKKFLYRMICADDGYRMCSAPCCTECDDFPVCFGDESGESLLALNRRRIEQAASTGHAT